MTPELQDYSNSGKFLEIQGTKVFYQEQGSGEEIVVLLHGFFSTGFHFRKLCEILKSKYKVISLDLPGVGWSERPSHPISHRLLAFHFEKFLTQIAPEKKVHLVTHDYGFVIAGLMLKTDPERVKSLSCINGFMNLPKFRSYLPLLLFRVPVLRHFFLLFWNPSGVRFFYNFFFAKKGYSYSKDWAKDTHHLLFDSSHRKNTLEFFQNIDFSIHALREIEEGVKSLVGLRQVIVSENDPYVKPEETEFIKEALRTSALFYVPGGHFPQEESPEKLAQILETVIDSSSRKKTITFHFKKTKSEED